MMREISWLFEMVMGTWTVALDGQQINSFQSQLTDLIELNLFEKVKNRDPEVRLPDLDSSFSAGQQYDLGEPLNLSVPQFFLLWNADHGNCYLMELV